MKHLSIRPKFVVITLLVLWVMGVIISNAPSLTAQVQNPNVNIRAVGGTAIGTSVPVTVVSGVATGTYTGTGATVITLSATSGTSITTATVYVQTARCNNTTAGSLSMNITDTAGTSLDTAFVIPANSSYTSINSPSGAKLVGIKMWASATPGINCILAGLQ